MCNISIYQILLSFDALLFEEFSHRDETEASLLENRNDLIHCFYSCLITLEIMEQENESILGAF